MRGSLRKALNIFQKHISKHINKHTFSKSIIDLLESLIKTKEKAAFKEISLLEQLIPRKKFGGYVAYHERFIPIIYAAKMALSDWKRVYRSLTLESKKNFSNTIFPLAKTVVMLKDLDLLPVGLMEKLRKYALSKLDNYQLCNKTEGQNAVCKLYGFIAQFCISIEDISGIDKIINIPDLNSHLIEIKLHNDLLIVKNKISRQSDQGIDDDSIRNYFKHCQQSNLQFESSQTHINLFYDLGRSLANSEDQDLLFALLRHCPIIGNRYPFIAGYLEGLISKSWSKCLKLISTFPCEYQEAFMVAADLNFKIKLRDTSIMQLIVDEAQQLVPLDPRLSRKYQCNGLLLVPRKSASNRKKGKEKVKTNDKKRKKTDSVQHKHKSVKRKKVEKEKGKGKGKEKEKEKDPDKLDSKMKEEREKKP